VEKVKRANTDFELNYEESKGLEKVFDKALGSECSNKNIPGDDRIVQNPEEE